MLGDKTLRGSRNVVNLSNANENSVKTYKNDVFGINQCTDEFYHSPFGHCSEYHNEETGTYYLRARYYDPKRGRFTQEDTLGLGAYSQIPSALMAMQIGNLYAYCVNNPVRYCDPSGHKVDLSPHVKQIAIDDGGASPTPEEPKPPIPPQKTDGNTDGSSETDLDGGAARAVAFDCEETRESQTGSLLEEPSQGDSVENEVNPATNESGSDDEVIRTSTELVLDSIGDMALFTAGYIVKISAEVGAVISYAGTAVVGTAAAPATGGLSAAAAFAFMVLIAETGYAIVGDVATVISAFAEYSQDNSVTLELFFPSSFEEVLEFVLSGPVRIGG